MYINLYLYRKGRYFYTFVDDINEFDAALRLVLNTTGFWCSEELGVEKWLLNLYFIHFLMNFSFNLFAPVIITKNIEKFIIPELPFNLKSLSASLWCFIDNILLLVSRASIPAQDSLLKALCI